MMMMTSTTTNTDKDKKETTLKELEKPLPTSSPSRSTRHWSSAGFRNPRIVRVSRAFGGKDRHSKVCTVRGLRDRRIRLSVPTAVQLYELQDRLGLAQPSKVIDWLIDNSKPDIDNLPPLPFPPFLPNHQFHLDHHHHHHHHPMVINKSNGHDLASLYHAPDNNNLQLGGGGVFPQNIDIDHHHHHNIRPTAYNQYYAGDHQASSSATMINGAGTGHVLQNYSLVSSLLLHNNNNNSNSSTANNNELLAPNNPSLLVKSFPAIFNNPRLLSSQASLFGNRLDKDNG